MGADVGPSRDSVLQVFIVTGYSGAGKSSVLRALEDVGFFCVDNLPLGFLTSFFQFIGEPQHHIEKIALGIDIRGGHNIQDLVNQLTEWNRLQTYKVKVIFLTASSEVLLKRFQETRRKHPLVDPLDLSDAIAYEKQLLQPLVNIADLIIDTDQFNIHDLRAFVRSSLAESTPKIMVTLVSFGFKYGVPPESNFVYDLRSLPNPYFIPALKECDGTQKSVHEYLFAQPEVQEYWQKLQDFVLFAVDKAYQEGRFFMHIALGCTGGRHRSVAFAEELARMPLEKVQFLVKHRDMYKDLLKDRER
jgi:RNase adapter protein RapZ